MKHASCDEIPANDLAVPGARDVTFRVLIAPEDAPNFIMLLLEVAPGGCTPSHSHAWEEEIFIRSGLGTVKMAGGDRPIRTGDALIFDSNMAHQFVNTGDEPLEFLCVIPRRD